MVDMRSRVIAAVLVTAALVSLTTFLAAAQHHGAQPDGNYVPLTSVDWHLSGADAAQRRAAMLQRAEWRLPPSDAMPITPDASGDRPLHDVRSCRFVNEPPSGTTAKFNCVLDGGRVIKVKYGRNPEIQGEAAATRLLRALGFPADEVVIVPRIRCYGCPRDPFVTVVASSWTSTREWLGPAGFDNGYTDFEWVAIERRFPAPAIETDDTKGWGWWEVRNNTAHRADLDALRLFAVFLAHWDNKAENQRLVCLDGEPPAPVPDCVRPLAMTDKAELDAGLAERIQRIARRAYRALDLNGYARIDFRLDEESRPQVLEANPNPNLAYGEDFAESAEVHGVSYERLLDRILTLGLRWEPERTG